MSASRSVASLRFMPDDSGKKSGSKSADEKPTAEQVAATTPEKPDEDQPTLTVERIITDAPALGLSSADVAGAYHGVKPSTEVTIADAKARVREWLQAPVKTDNQE